MNYCCICCRETNHPKSFHCSIDDSVYHYCHRHAYIGRRVSNKYVAKKVLTKEQEEVKKNISTNPLEGYYKPLFEVDEKTEKIIYRK